MKIIHQNCEQSLSNDKSLPNNSYLVGYIIEDVQSWDWIDILKENTPEHLKQYIKVYDLRPNKDRYDDIVFTIDKSNI